MSPLDVGIPYLSGSNYRVTVSWSSPSQTGSSAVKEYEIAAAGESWTAAGNKTSTTLTLGVPVTRRLKIRACNYENRCGGWSNPKYLSGNTFPTTTTIAVPRYELDEYQGKNQRWDPCAGPVTIKLNPMGHLTSSEIDEWSTLLRGLTAEISSMTGLNVVYGGQTGKSFRLSHPGGRTSADVLIGFAPIGTEHMLGDDPNENYFGTTQEWISSNQTPDWWTQTAADIQIATNSNNGVSEIAPKGRRTTYLMHKLGGAFGLASPGDDIDTEIMSWGGDGSGTRNNPDWGEGDKIGFGLVGASNGCFETSTTATTTTTTTAPTTSTPLTPALALCVSEPPIETIQCTEEIATAAFTEIRQRLVTSPEVSLNFDSRISSNSTTSSVTRVSNALRPGVSFWASEVPSDTSTIVFIVSGSDLDWFENEMVSLGWTDTEFFTLEDRTALQNGSLGKALALRSPTNDGRKVIAFFNISNFFSSSRASLGVDPGIAVAAHEWTHTVQGVLSENYFSFPCWWTEGSAGYFSEAISVLDNINSFGDFLPIRSRYVRSRVEIEASHRTEDAWADWLEIEECTDDSYGAGFLVAEYLIGQYGIPKVIEMMDSFGREVPWQSVMEQTFGRLRPHLYSEIATHLRSVFGSTAYVAN
jgi:hypothetical protein